MLSINTTCVKHQHHMCGHSTHRLKIRRRVQKCLHLYDKKLMRLYSMGEINKTALISSLLLDKLLTVLYNYTLIILTYTLTCEIIDRCTLIHSTVANFVNTCRIILQSNSNLLNTYLMIRGLELYRIFIASPCYVNLVSRYCQSCHR